MRADEHVHRAVREALERTTLLRRRHKAREHGHLEVKRRKPREERLEVLLRQDGRGAQHHHLLGVLAALERGPQRDLRLAKAHVAAEQPVHGPSRLHVGLDVCDGGALVGRELVAEARLHLLLDRRVGREGKPRDRGAARVEVHEVEGELLRGLARLVRGPTPVRGVEAREARAAPVRAHVAREAVDLLERHEELVLAGILQQEVVALAPRDLLAHDGREERDAVRRVDHVVARLEREGHARGVHAARAASGLCGAGAEVGDREDGQARARHLDACGDGGVGEGDLSARKGRYLRVVVLGRRAQRLDEGDVLVGEAQLERLARAAVRDREEHGRAVAHELAHAPDELCVGARDLGLAHGELGRGRTGARTQHGREGQALLAAKVHLARRGVEPLERDAGRVGRGEDLVGLAHAVVKEGARLGEHHERAGAEVLERRGGGAVELREVALERGSCGTLANELQVGGHLGALLGLLEQRPLGSGDGLVREGELAARRDRHLAQLADGLPRRGDHPAHAVDLVAKELDPHGRGRLRGEDVDGVPVHVEGAGRVHVAGVVVAHAHEQRGNVLEGDLLAHAEGARGEVAAALGRNATQQGVGRRHDHAALASGEARDGAAPRADDGVVGGGICPGPVAAVGVAAHDVLPEPRREGARRAVRRLLAGDHEQAGTRVRRPEGREDERAGGLRHGKRGVAAGIELPHERAELRAREQLARNAIDEHGGPLHRWAPAPAGGVGARKSVLLAPLYPGRARWAQAAHKIRADPSWPGEKGARHHAPYASTGTSSHAPSPVERIAARARSRFRPSQLTPSMCSSSR